MKLRKKVAVVVGARPNFVKCTCLLKEFEKHKELFAVSLINTDQHYDHEMAGVFFKELEISPPTVSLNAVGKSQTQTIANILRRMQILFSQHRFDYVIVFGDVNSTLATAIASAKAGERLVHVESGLRCHDRRIPEEINRVVTDHISDILFTSEDSAMENLKEEDMDMTKVYLVGNIMIDTLVRFNEKIDRMDTCRFLGVEEGSYVLATIHRQENVDDPTNLVRIFTLLKEISTRWPLVIPLHPRTAQQLIALKREDLLEGIKHIEPQSYLNFIHLVKHAKAVITDSGGIQEETTFLNVPCITFRDNTERPITVTKGTNTLVNIQEAIPEEVISLITHPKRRKEVLPLWDGKTSERIVALLKGPGDDQFFSYHR